MGLLEISMVLACASAFGFYISAGEDWSADTAAGACRCLGLGSVV